MAGGEDDSGSRAEQISALLDGELSIEQTRLLLYHMVDGDARECWDLYHLIGDALRGQTDRAFLAINLVPGISKRLENEQ